MPDGYAGRYAGDRLQKAPGLSSEQRRQLSPKLVELVKVQTVGHKLSIGMQVRSERENTVRHVHWATTTTMPKRLKMHDYITVVRGK